MKLRHDFNIPGDMPQVYIKTIIKDQTREFLDSMLGEIVPEKWYGIRLQKQYTEDPSNYNISYRLIFDIEEISEYTSVYIPPEKMYLKPEKSLRYKLRNCFQYLRDKTGGKYEAIQRFKDCEVE